MAKTNKYTSLIRAFSLSSPSQILPSHKMTFQISILCFMIFFLLIIPLPFCSCQISKPGCPDRCGSVSIPFPFGIGSDCSLTESFNITCNTASTNNTTPKPYLSFVGDIEVVEINPSQIRVRFQSLLGLSCYDESGRRLNGSELDTGYSLYNSPYTFSSANWLTAIGCDDLATNFVTDDEGFSEDQQKYGRSCVSYCRNVNGSYGSGFCPVTDAGYPPSEGCCVTSIAGGMNQISVQLTDLSSVWRSTSGKFFSCSYAFIQEKVNAWEKSTRFSYPLSILNNPNVFLGDRWDWKARAPPVVRLDWRIDGAKNCSHAQQNATAYACRDNSVCVHYGIAGVGGYRCNCSQGYHGNPYISRGCTDIDECRDYPCVPNSDCINKEGSFVCTCRRGHYGDGMKNGSGCIPRRINNIFIGVGSGLGFFLLLSICFLLQKILQKKRIKTRREKLFKQNGGLLLQQRTNEGTIGKTLIFCAEELEKATDNFNSNRILGQGGQGVVYKGMLSDGKIVAIKKPKLLDKNHLDQFINEVLILSQINHRNIVQLLGCCLETEIPLLIYEFLPNGTLHDLIHDPKVEFIVSWSMRLKMAADIAGALAYMHCASSTSIYHRDIKSSNILLDEKYVVKVSDFGISRFVAVDRTHLTTQVKGTFGYFDPEYFQSNQFTEKSDVYSFGVVLAELLTGQKPISSERDEEERSLVTRFLACIEDNNLEAILDAQVPREEVHAVALLAQRCLNLHGKMRPTMKDVATELESLRICGTATENDESQETARLYEGKAMIVPNVDYTWSKSDISETPSYSDTQPFKSETF